MSKRILAVQLVLLAAGAPASAQELTYVDHVLDTGVLTGVESVVVSPDGAFVYSAAFGTNSIGVYARNPSTGLLTFSSVATDGVGGVTGLDDVSSIALSPNGSRLYAAAEFDDALTVFSRNALNGALTPIQTLFDGVGGVDGLNAAEQLVLSPDGSSLYVTARFDSSVAAFDVDPVDGTLGFVRKRDTEIGVYSVGTPDGLAVSPGGGTTYVANLSANPNRLNLFDRTAGTSDIDYSGTTILSTPQQPLSGVTYMAASPDGADLYIAATGERAISIFEINGAELTGHGFVPDGAGGAGGSGSGVQGFVLNDAGTRLYAGLSGPAAVTVFARNPSTGALTFLEAHTGEVAAGVTLGNSGLPALSPNGAQLYVPDASGKIVVFAVAAPEAEAGALGVVAALALVALRRHAEQQN